MNRQWQEVERIFHAALEAEEGRRAAVIAEYCAGDESLRREVESLLAYHQNTAGLFETPAFARSGDAQQAEKENSAAETATPRPSGQLIGHYRVLEEIGGGGMGVVYKAVDTKLGRTVALKFLPAKLESDPAALERLQREARAASALNHPNICTIYDIEEFDRQHFIAMEYLEGKTIQDHIGGRALDADEISKLGIQIAEALSAAHSKGIVHRDIKPGNIILTTSGAVKVLDFGLAKLLQPEGETEATAGLTAEHQVVGTLPYMSPEQVRGRKIDARSDIYGLGLVLYEMATGRRPYVGKMVSQLIDEILNSPPPDPRELNAELPVKLQEIILKCIEKDPESRYQTAKEVGVDLRRMTAASATASVIAPRKARQRKRVTAYLVAAAVVVAIIVTAWTVLRPRTATPSGTAAWVQLTDFPDSATSPGLSPDGRMVAFLRGPSTLTGPGDVYIKLLPRGEPLQLTYDGEPKQDPRFSPDGSRVVYSQGVPPMEIWSVPVLGGQPELLMRNASSLSWIGNDRLLFAEIKSGLHIGIVTAGEGRTGQRDLYLPERQSGQLTRKIYARGLLAWQRTHGGLRIGSPTSSLLPPGELNTPILRQQADRMRRTNHFHTGVGVAYSFPSVDVFASYIAFVSGTDTHAGRAITAGVSWPFELRRGGKRH